MKKGLFTFLLTCILAVMSLSAQVENPATWTFSRTDLGKGEYELTMKAILEPGWKVYSMFTPEGGPLATTLTLNEEGKGVEFIGKAVENEPQKHFDELFGVDVWYFESEYIIRQKVKVTDPALAVVKGTLEYQVCQNGQCILFDTDFDIPLGGQQQNVNEKTATEQIQTMPGESSKDESLWTFFWLAFIAGLAAVVMPCVFPMIPMTVSFFMHGDANKAKAKVKA